MYSERVSMNTDIPCRNESIVLQDYIKKYVPATYYILLYDPNKSKDMYF
jgi:hypothetical protein